MKNLLVNTFSGGRTSAFMAQFVLNHPKYDDFDKVYIFANTGKEMESTLEFIEQCSKYFKIDIVWLEAAINYEKGKGTGFKIVNYDTASRDGEPFEDMLKKYPLPNNKASNCTRELKQIPISKYVKSLGYDKVYTTMGIRYDERHRISINAENQNIIYPLVYDIQVDYKFIRSWWDRQPFDLKLKDYQGNCDLCFKKSLKKRLTLINENPNISKWWLDMEKKYGSEKVPRFDLRTNKSITELIKLSKKDFSKAKDLHELTKEQQSLFNFETDCFCKAN